MDEHVKKSLEEGGIDVQDLLERCMGSEALLARLLKKFPTDVSYDRLCTAVDVGDEVLRPLGQVEDGLQVDDLRERRARGGELLREELQVLAVGRGILGGPGLLGHGAVPSLRSSAPRVRQWNRYRARGHGEKNTFVTRVLPEPRVAAPAGPRAPRPRPPRSTS